MRKMNGCGETPKGQRCWSAVLFGNWLETECVQECTKSWQTPEGRSSAIFALRPSLRNQVDLERFGGGVKVGVREFWKDVKSGRYNVNAPKDMRIQQKQEMKKKGKQV
jgi:hypothetical protein